MHGCFPDRTHLELGEEGWSLVQVQPFVFVTHTYVEEENPEFSSVKHSDANVMVRDFFLLQLIMLIIPPKSCAVANY